VSNTGDKPRRQTVELTNDQMSVLQCITRGRLIEQAASELGIGIEEYQTRLTGLYRALGAKNRAEAVLNAREAGLI
jgi:DNA-binding NarL/FixJ family response regulator